ncbi:MAG: hypothetical protein J5835_02790, partial [Bacteroidales bacterium]|nr:hypothetical protein [Bacteroidales bacterium]
MLPFFTANAQRARLYTTEYGLPNSQVNSIFQDAQGFIWISTENGLARFDGRDFVTFRHVRDKEDALASDLVLTFFQDKRNTFWVGTSTGLQTFDPSLRSFTRVDLGDPLYPGSTQHISVIKEIRTGIGESEIWVGSSQHGVYVLDAESHVTKDDRRSKLSPSLASAIVYRMFQDSRGWVWIAGETGGLTVVDASSLEKQDIPLSPSIAIKDFEEDPASGNVLLATMTGLYIYDASKGVIRQSSDPGARACRAFSLLYDSTLNRAGGRSFWVGAELDGLNVYDMAADRISPADLPSVGRDISRWKVHSLIQDNQGNIWVGAYQTGVMVIPSSMYGFECTRVDYGCVSSVAKDPRDGSLCVGTDGGGIHIIAPDGSRKTIDASSTGLMVDSVTDMVFDRSGKLWIATYLGGLFTYTHSRGLRPFAGSADIGTNNLACLAYDALGDILYVGTYGAGMSIVDATREVVTEKVAEDINMWVSALYIDRMGTVWIGTFNGPMFYNHVVGRLYPYDVENALGKARVYCFHEGSDGVLWIGTGEGLAACDRNGASVRYYTEADGLSSNVISAILEAGDGTLWISTSFGLNRMNQKTRAFTSYYSYDGLHGSEFHHGAALQDSDGKLYFGGTDGVTSFFPQVVLQKVHSIPLLYFTRLTVLNQEVDFDSESRLTLPSGSSTFSTEFSVLEYTNPMKIRYTYKLEGFDNEWRILPASSHEVSYSNLPSGRYTLNVKAYFDGTPQNYSSASLKIKVMPPWYLSPGAFIIYLALFVAMIWVFAYFVKRRQEHVKEREASEIKELKLKMFTNISHEIRTPLTLLMSPLKQMREAEKDPHQKDLYNLMYRNSLRILRLVNQIMDMRKVDEGKMLLHFLETDVVFFVRDIMQSFNDMAVTRKIDLSLSPASEVINLWIDQGNFDKIVFNLLSNAFKHTPDGGRISIGISAPEKNQGELADEIDSQVRITITNSGSHIDETNLDKVFERFFQNDVLDAKMGSGVGLSLT